MNSQPPINSELRLPSSPPMWVKGAFYTSAAALAVSTVAMAVLLTIYPQMGIVGFSLLSGAETISCVLFAVSFYLLNRKQDEHLAKLHPPELIVEQPPERENRPSSGDGPSSFQGRSSADLMPEEDHDVIPEDNRGGSVVSDTPPVLLSSPIPEENEDARSGVRESSSDVPSPTLLHVASEDSEGEEDFELLDSGTLSLIPDAVVDVQDNPTLDSVPVKSLEYIDGFRKTLPQLFEAGQNFFIAFVSAYARSEGKRPDKKTIGTIQQSFQTLFQVVDTILQDNVQLFRFTLGALVTSFLDEESLSPFLETHKNPMEFVRALASFLPEDARNPEALESTQGLLMIAEKTKRTDSKDQKTLQALYTKLQKASAQLKEANRRVDEETRKEDNAKGIEKAEEAQQEKETEFNGALMALVDWLFFKCEPDEMLLKKIVAKHVAPTIETLRTMIMSHIPDILWQIKGAYGEGSPMNNTLVKSAIYGATSFGGKLIRSKVNSAINSVPLAERYRKALIDGFVEIFIPTLMNPFYYATVGDKSTFSSDPHPLRAALKTQMIDLEDFALLRKEEAPESEGWAGYAAAYAKILSRFTEQLNGLRFR